MFAPRLRHLGFLVALAACGGDAGRPPVDAAVNGDAATADAAAVDAAAVDAALDAAADAAAADAAAVDAAAVDAAAVDAAAVDAAAIDAAAIDALVVDAAPIDALVVDAASVDAASVDAALVDAAAAPLCANGPGRVLWRLSWPAGRRGVGARSGAGYAQRHRLAVSRLRRGRRGARGSAPEPLRAGRSAGRRPCSDRRGGCLRNASRAPGPGRSGA